MKGWRFWTLLCLGFALLVAVVLDVVLRTPFRADQVVWGNVASWVTGTATVLVATLAARFAWESAQASKRVVRLTAMATKVAFRCEVMTLRSLPGGDESPDRFEYEIRITLTEDSTPCYLRGASFRPTRAFSFEENWPRNTLNQAWVYMDTGIHLSPGESRSNIWEVDSLDHTAPHSPPGNKENTVLSTIYYTLEGPVDPPERTLSFNTRLVWIDDDGALFDWV